MKSNNRQALLTIHNTPTFSWLSYTYYRLLLPKKDSDFTALFIHHNGHYGSYPHQKFIVQQEAFPMSRNGAIKAISQKTLLSTL